MSDHGELSSRVPALKSGFTDLTRGGRPLVYMTDWSSRHLSGPGRMWTTTALLRRWEMGSGCVTGLTPEPADLDDFFTGLITRDKYFAYYFASRPPSHNLAPGRLAGTLYTHPSTELVASGDTLCCVCSREGAARGECRRVWAAQILVPTGWAVVLNSEVMKP